MVAAPLGFKRAENGHKSVFGREQGTPHSSPHTSVGIGGDQEGCDGTEQGQGACGWVYAGTGVGAEGT